ncbi:MAG: enoyl-CoA hydratase/isomerase family protein [Anaerolineales bacterium]|nr:enoyl-CoA hydratase/isomerase family protein [Anaerolineales bacterium]
MSYDFLYDVHEGVATITFNRPDVLNAITFEIYAQFRDLMAALQFDDAVKAVVITGAGRAFCSGGDVFEIIGELLPQDVKGHLDFTRMTGATVANMRLLEKPIIAAINGMAAGAGSVIALAWVHKLSSRGLLSSSRPTRALYQMRFSSMKAIAAIGAANKFVASCASSLNTISGAVSMIR